MASAKQQLSNKLADFFYDHQAVPAKGKAIRKSYKEVEKMIQKIGTKNK